ncbi:DUF1289 domain-containing protein [Azospirillum ramasamyi]|uniref:DUF1289 domain-containing protein n=1 Tax=Azospirillum ramasamyi TaxID=682998 RepID=A0A2U9SFJ8_9PROT|nr:DUF1289 domain-containing protein [Azospirillum ramasamyi]AWU96558.1 DUF1289 domain-containing protein [Azospirillum ramasamyi]
MSSIKLGGRNSKDGAAAKDTGNPCIGLCRFGGQEACLGCHRTKAEVKGWKKLSDAAKAAINQRIRQEAGQAPPVKGADGKAPRKRLRKLDRKIGKLEAKLAALRAERDAIAGAG